MFGLCEQCTEPDQLGNRFLKTKNVPQKMLWIKVYR